MTGVIADRFELEELVGQGYTGRVYRAKDLASGERVAVKLFHEHSSDDEEARDKRFEMNARVSAKIEHPCLVRHVAHGLAAPGVAYLVTEWLEGESLASRLARERLSLKESLELARCVAGALSAAHACCVLHRDIKPSNVFLVNGGAARSKVLDLASMIFEVGRNHPEGTGRPARELGYMAPEVARGDYMLTPSSDVFSLGCLLFEILIGRPPFQGANFVEFFVKLLTEEPPRIRDLRPEVPEALSALIARMMAKKPDARPVDGAAVLRELEEIA